MHINTLRKLSLRSLALAAAAVLAVGALTACGFSRDSVTGASSGSTGGIMMSGARNAVATEELAAYDMAAETAAGEDSGSLISSDRKLVKTYYISLESTSFDETVDLIKTRAEEFGGYIESSSVSGTTIRYESSGTRYAYIVVRIPTDRVEEYLAEAEDAGNVLQKQEEIEDITLQYTDTESYLEALTLEQSRLMELIGEAETVEDLIALNSRLTEVERLIESNTRQIRLYDNQIDYTSVSFDISEVRIYTPAAEESIIERMKRGLSENIEGIKDSAVDGAVWLVSHIPSILIWIVIILILVLLCRKTGVLSRIKGIKVRQRDKKPRTKDDNASHNETS